jgi:hypothetical protein
MRGGSKNYIKYIYTRDEKRGAWVDTIYPFGKTITSILPKINWYEFKYDGNFILEVTDISQNSESSEFVVKAGGDSIIQDDIKGTLENVKGAPYEVFGGAACEIWGSEYPNVPIRKYVDITGDIDVNISMPTFVPDEMYRTDYEFKYTDVKPLILHEGTYTPYGEAFTSWVFNNVVREFTKISPMFNIKELTPPRMDEDHETAIGDLNTTTGNLLITRLIGENKDMVKIQVTTKVLPNIVNHIIEFIILKNGTFQSKSKYAINDIHVQSIYELLLSQVEGLTGRIAGIRSGVYEDPIGAPNIDKYPSLYKFDNHCARLLYLAKLMKDTEGKKFNTKTKFDYMTVWQAVIILEKLYKNDSHQACNIHFGSGYINKLIDIFETMQYIGKGKLTSNLDPAQKKKLNLAKKSLGGRRTRKRK